MWSSLSVSRLVILRLDRSPIARQNGCDILLYKRECKSCTYGDLARFSRSQDLEELGARVVKNKIKGEQNRSTNYNDHYNTIVPVRCI